MIGQTFRTVAGLNRDLRTLFVATLVFRAGTMAFPYLSIFLLSRGTYSPFTVGLIIGAFGVGALVADFSASMFLGRVTPRTMMLMGLVVNAIVLTVVPLLTSVLALVVATFVWGIAYEIFTPSAYSLTVDRSSSDERKVAFSCNRLAINLGMGVGPAVGGLVFAVEPMALFMINAVCVLVAAGYLWGRTRRSAANTRHLPEPLTKRQLISPTAREESQFWTIFGLAIPIHLAYALPPVLISVYIIEGLHLPSYWASAVFMVNAACIVLFEVPVNRAMQAVEHSRSLLLGYALAGLGFGLMGVSGSGPLIVLATLIWTAAEMIVFPSLLSYISQLSDRSISNRNMSLYSAGVNIGLIATPQISLALRSQWNETTPWLAAGFTIGAAFVLMLGARQSRYTWFVEEPDAGPVGQRISEGGAASDGDTGPK